MIVIVKLCSKLDRTSMVSTKKIIKVISEKEMDRRDFLKYSGYALIGLIGLKGVVGLFLPQINNPTKVAKREITVKSGFGSGKYGA